MTTLLHAGLGRTGLPQALVAADSGFEVYGTDTNRVLVSQLEKGQVPFDEPGMKELLEKHAGKGFVAVQQERLADIVPKCDYIMLSVTLRFENGDMRPKLDNLIDTIKSLIQLKLKRGAVLIMRSTMPIGTIDRLKSLIEEQCGLKESQDYYLAFVPERLVEGYAVREERTVPKIIGTYSPEGAARVEELYKHIGGKLIRVANPRTAEMAKLTDNSFRSTLFSFSNDLARLAEENEIDALEVITACNAQYPRNSIPLPGPVSGTCLARDPYILAMADGARSRNGTASLWYHGRKANDSLVDHVAETVAAEVEKLDRGNAVNMLVLGLSYREDVDDFRLSHALDMIRKLVALVPQANLSVYDPAIGKSSYSMLPEDIARIARNKYTELTPEVFEGVNVAVLTDRHHELVSSSKAGKLERVLRKRAKPLIIYDCWNIWREASKLDGVVYRALGLGVTK